jgi:hypothetical protein
LSNLNYNLHSISCSMTFTSERYFEHNKLLNKQYMKSKDDPLLKGKLLYQTWYDKRVLKNLN